MNYSESMSKRQQRRKALNQRFRRMFLVALLMGLAMGFVFGRCSAVNSKAPDVPIEPDQLTAVIPDVTLEPVEPPLVEEPAEPEPVLLGSFRITAYCSCEKCCGEWAKNRPNGIVYEWLIHSWDYGVELHNLIGKDVEYCIPEIERRVREALLQDDRITAVQNFEFTVNKKKVLTTFTVVSIFGEINAELGVEI